MADSLFGGYTSMPGRWHSNVTIGKVNAMPIEWIVDSTLPSLGQDLYLPNRDFVVLPRGRAVAASPTTLTRLDGRTIVTLANGVNPKAAPSFATGMNPIGYSPFHFYREFSGLPAARPTVTLHETIELPYTAVNESYNTGTNGGSRLMVGEWMMPFYGSAVSSTAIVPQDKGKFVRWLPRKIFTQTGTASAAVKLTEAPFPAFLPRVLLAYNGTTLDTTGTVSLHYNNSLRSWVATYGQSITTVVFEYGAGDEQRCAQIVNIEPVGTAGGVNATSHELGGWLKWVRDNFGVWDWPPIMDIRPTTSVTDEVVSISNGAGTIANIPIVPFKTITVTVTGTLTAADGTQTTLSGVELAGADPDWFNDQSQGLYFDINFLTGALTFTSNLDVDNCTVSYSYENDFRDGRKHDAGILGLTDGRDSGIVGLPPHLDVAGVMGRFCLAFLNA